MTESNWKIVSRTNLIPVGVTLHNDVIGQTLNVPTLYDPSSEEVFVLDHNFLQAEATKAVKDFIRQSRSSLPEIENVVDRGVWENIRNLRGLAKPPAQEL